jgi:ATP-dependent DNA helicase RecQ
VDGLSQTLKQIFGFRAFRPLQREIIETSMDGRDVFALLPTGGGKSLCYQLPALLRSGLTVVVCPLIALMKDQVDQLQAAGVAATFLNSTLGAKEARSRLARLHNGEWRLLYVSPERLMLDGWLENLEAWNVAAFAIDEAHCISEWGHDFRPEYRQLSILRARLPDVPIIALTATATNRVQGDVIRRLRLKNPEIFIASFNRPNLTYRVLPKERPLDQVLKHLKGREEEGGIIYCATRAGTERLASSLSDRGYQACTYHAGLPAGERNRNQEAFLHDDIRIVCATIAFGMGIDKPNVRWIIHHDLPKNLEGYYQETGRAGRDGLPSECLLLYSAGDAAKQMHFIREISDPTEKQVAGRQLQTMLHFAESAGCRRAEVLAYFGEESAETNCGSCDNCQNPRESYDGTIQAQKLLSCVYRVTRKSRFDVGMNHLIEILTGANTEKVRRWGHDQLSTFGIGRDLARSEWSAVGRDLLRQGYLEVADGRFATVNLTEQGKDVLRTRTPITLTKPMTKPAKRPQRRRAGAIECDEFLFEHLRRLRKQMADERLVPAYVICGDATLREMAREYPTSLSAMEPITGLGSKKLAEFGQIFADAIAEFLETHCQIEFANA